MHLKVDNYVYIHNAFRNDLQRIVASCENNGFILSELESWRDILNLHSRVEDEIIIVGLKACLRELNLLERLLHEIGNSSDHKLVKDILGKALKCNDNKERLNLLHSLADELDKHLQKEEEAVMPLLLEAFTRRELWALDSFIVNPNLDYAGEPSVLMAITKWWFGNISVKEGWPLLQNFIKAGNQKPMPQKRLVRNSRTRFLRCKSSHWRQSFLNCFIDVAFGCAKYVLD